MVTGRLAVPGHWTTRRHLGLAARVSALVVAGAVSFVAARRDAVYGMDSEAMWFGSHDLLAAGNPYVDHAGHNLFVYPPSCALLFAPFSVVTNRAFVAGMLLLDLFAMVALGLGLAKVVGKHLDSWWATAIATVTVLSPLGLASVGIGNASVLVAALGTWSLIMAAGTRWTAAAVLLGVAIAIKPLVVLFLLVFLCRRAARALFIAALIPIALNVGALLWMRDPSVLVHTVLPRLVAGSLLPLSANASLWARGESIGAAPEIVWAVRAAVVVLGVACVWGHRRAEDLRGLCCLCLAPTVAVFLVSRVDEPHYNLLTVVLCLALIIATPRPVGVLAALCAVVFLLVPTGELASWLNTMAQLTVLVCAVWLGRISNGSTSWLVPREWTAESARGPSAEAGAGGRT